MLLNGKEAAERLKEGLRRRNNRTVMQWTGDLVAVSEFLGGFPIEFFEEGERLRLGLPGSFPAVVQRGDWIIRAGTLCCGVVHVDAIEWLRQQSSIAQRLTWLLPSMTEFIEDAEKRAQESVSDDVFPHDAQSLERLQTLLRGACRRWLMGD